MAYEDLTAEQKVTSPQSGPEEKVRHVDNASQHVFAHEEGGAAEKDGPQEPEPETAAENSSQVSPDLNEEVSGQHQEDRQPTSDGADDKGVAAKSPHKVKERDIEVDSDDSAVAIGDHARATNTKLDLREANIRNLLVKYGETEKLSLIEVKAQDQERIARVFAAPENYGSQYAGLVNSEQRVYIVHGADQSGKYTCAVKLALDLQASEVTSDPNIAVYRRTARDRNSLLDFAHHGDVRAGTIYIVEDAFDNGVRLADLTGPDLPALNAALADSNNRLILTTEYKEDQLATLQVPKISALVAPERMAEVLEKHLSYYREPIGESSSIPSNLLELAQKNVEELAKSFLLPPQIEVFCEGLKSRHVAVNEPGLLEHAQWVAQLGQNPRSWFEQLSKNARLYAMLAALFDTIDRQTLDDIYVTAVQELRLQGVTNLSDPREQGLDDLLDQIHARENEAHQVRFDNRALEREARRQINNHRHLLWSLLSLVLAMIEDFRAPQYWEFRNALGAAIGALGIFQLPKLTRALEQLADHPSGGVVAVVGYALGQICHTEVGHHDYVVRLLEEWTRSGDPDRMWAVPASIWRLYDGLVLTGGKDEDPRTSSIASETAVKVRETLTLAAERFDQFNKQSQQNALRLALDAPADAPVSLDRKYSLAVVLKYEVILHEWALANVGSVLHAIHQMSRNHARDVVVLLRKWLCSEDENHLRDMAILAGQQLFFENSSSDLLLTTERHAPLLDLIEPLLSADPKAAQIVLQTLLQWLRSPGWPEHVHRSLLKVANRVKGPEAKTLQTVLLNEWLESDQTDAHRIASSVIGRLYVMRGTPMDMPENSQASVILDATPRACQGRNAANIGYQLHARLDGLLDTWILRMGQREALVKPRQPKPSLQLQPDYPRPRLLAPPLETLDPATVSLVLALVWRSPLDAEDLISGSWPERLVVASVTVADGGRKATTENESGRRTDNAERQWWAEIVAVPANSLSLDDVEDVVLRRLARSLAARPAAVWWSILEKALDLPADDTALLNEKLTEWTTLLDNEQHAGIARNILCSMLWLSAADPLRCVELLSAWLVNSNELTRLAGAACGAAIFRLYAEYQPSPDLERVSVLLGLAPRLAKEGWHRAETVVSAARRWSRDPAWADRLLMQPNGGPSELVQMVDSLPASDHYKLDAELSSWLEANAGQTEPSEQVRRLVQRLQVQIALAVRTELPELPPGHMYVMIAMDHANGRSPISQNIAGMASRLIEKLSVSPQEKIHVLTYRLGQDVPIAGPEERPTAEQLVARAQPPRPRTIGPLLEIQSSQQIGAVLLLVDWPPLDAEDWVGSEWSDHVLMCSVFGRRHEISTFTVAPEQGQRSPQEYEDLIIRSLKQILGV